MEERRPRPKLIERLEARRETHHQRSRVYRIGFTVLGALILAGICIFATLSHNVAGRVPEYAIRLALGATPANVRVGVLGSGLRLALTGAVIGGVLAAAASRAIGQLLYGVSPADPLAYASACIVLLAISLAACWLPARRAARVDPMKSLRGD